MATKKFLIEVEEGETCCDNCPMECQGYCPSTTMGVLGRCDELNLATMKIKEYENDNRDTSTHNS